MCCFILAERERGFNISEEEEEKEEEEEESLFSLKARRIRGDRQ